MTDGRRVQLLVHLASGGLLALLAVLAGYMPGSAPGWGPSQTYCLAAGFVVVALGFIPGLGAVTRLSTRICLSFLSFCLLLGLSEGFFRAIRFDFAKEEQAWRRTPPFFRYPNVPTGQVFFRRSGPEQWTGQVLNTMLKQLGVLPNPYGNEPAIVVTYNRDGFRNPDNMADWDIAIAGDSFTELGYLPDEQLFTTLVGKALNVAVLNLGVSYTGPLTALSYLQDYGVSARTRQAVVVFFEGNDLSDLDSEYRAVAQWQRNGQRPYREFKEQTSFVTAVRAILHGPPRAVVKPDEVVTAYFKSAGSSSPITLVYTPPGSSELSDETKRQLNYFFERYAVFGKERHLVLSLAYMPTKERVLHGQIAFAQGASEKLRNWRPTDLPQVIAALCGQYGINFIDLTSALVDETKSKSHLVYNAIYDTHLNVVGSEVVAREMARHLAIER